MDCNRDYSDCRNNTKGDGEIMKRIADIFTVLIEGTTTTQKFISLIIIVIVVAGIIAYFDYNKTDIEIHKIHKHIDVDTIYLPMPREDKK